MWVQECAETKQENETMMDNSFYCSIRQSAVEKFSLNERECAVVAVRSQFSGMEYWNEAVPSVAASALSEGICFEVKAGIAAYLYRETAFSATLCITVNAFAPAARRTIAKSDRFARHAAPSCRRVSCGHLTRKCTALTL